MTEPNDSAYPENSKITDPIAYQWGFTKREDIAKSVFVRMMGNRNEFAGLSVSDCAHLAIKATDVFIEELNKTP